MRRDRKCGEQRHEEQTEKAKITKAYNLPCRYILHTVGPIINGPLTNKDCEELVDTLLVHIHEHFDQKMELNALSELVYCSESHMARVFKKHMGMSIISYVHKIRIEKSIKMLLENGSVKETAEAVGYQNLNHFYKYFNQYMGMAPAAYIRKRRENYGKDG